MRDRETTGSRCERCRLLLGLCVCSMLPRIETRTRLVLIMHCLEARKSTNTGRFAALCLTNTQVVLRGDGERSDAHFACDDGSRPLFLFPHPGAPPLARPAADEGPVTLVVPDGTWRQASKVRKRVPGLDGLPCVALPPEGPSDYRLRRWPHEEGLSTLEAVARAMGVLEGEGVRRELELVLRVMVERTLWSRGRLDARKVAGGIPEAARR